MASAKAVLGSWLGSLVFTSASVSEVELLSPNFRRVTLEGKGLASARWSAGDKLQMFLPSGEMRTYTPLHWDNQHALTSIVLYVHGNPVSGNPVRGDAPGAHWAKHVAQGDSVQFFGPRKSLNLVGCSGPQILFGDETSFGVAAALVSLRQGRDVDLVFEVSREAEAREVLTKLGLKATLIERAPEEAHFSALTARLQEAQSGGFSPIFTGRAQAIQALQRNLGRGFRGLTKAYWALGKRGLD